MSEFEKDLREIVDKEEKELKATAADDSEDDEEEDEDEDEEDEEVEEEDEDEEDEEEEDDDDDDGNEILSAKLELAEMENVRLRKKIRDLSDVINRLVELTRE